MSVEEDKTHLKERIARALADHLRSGKTIEQLAPAGRKRPRRQAQDNQASASDAPWPELLGAPDIDATHD